MLVRGVRLDSKTLRTASSFTGKQTLWNPGSVSSNNNCIDVFLFLFLAENKHGQLHLDDYGRDILSVQALLTKHVREGGREGGSEGGRKGAREGGREEGRESYS